MEVLNLQVNSSSPMTSVECFSLTDADTEEQEAHEPAVSINVIIIAAVSGFVAIVIAVCVSVVIVLRMSMRRENSTGNETVAAPVENQGFEVNDINKTV